MKQTKQSIIARFFKERRGDAEHNPEYVDLARRSGILGAIVGDIVGSVHEFVATKTTQFELFVEDSRFTRNLQHEEHLMATASASYIKSGYILLERLFHVHDITLLNKYCSLK